LVLFFLMQTEMKLKSEYTSRRVLFNSKAEILTKNHKFTRNLFKNHRFFPRSKVVKRKFKKSAEKLTPGTVQCNNTVKNSLGVRSATQHTTNPF
jgi:hypothetical protein